MMMSYRILREQEIERELFHAFIRRQAVDKCLRRENGNWVVRSAPFIDDWTEDDYRILIDCLRNTVRTGGFVYGGFFDGKLKGFVSAENGFFGGENRYCDLSSLHVSEDMRRKGIGKTLFHAAADWARKQGAKKLYISAHSAAESQAFYCSIGCADACEYDKKHAESEPYDRQMEYVL
ncbi:MAG: GNAT family N-acetyltransferase [Ruminococcus sp.]|nr:GNAT family N-acetyltransferase [Ruminococcus sp.]